MIFILKKKGYSDIDILHNSGHNILILILSEFRILILILIFCTIVD